MRTPPSKDHCSSVASGHRHGRTITHLLLQVIFMFIHCFQYFICIVKICFIHIYQNRFRIQNYVDWTCYNWRQYLQKLNIWPQSNMHENFRTGRPCLKGLLAPASEYIKYVEWNSQNVLPFWGLHVLMKWSSLIQVTVCRLFGVQPLPEPMLTYSQLDLLKQTSVKFSSKCKPSFNKMCLKVSLAVCQDPNVFWWRWQRPIGFTSVCKLWERIDRFILTFANTDVFALLRCILLAIKL